MITDAKRAGDTAFVAVASVCLGLSLVAAIPAASASPSPDDGVTTTRAKLDLTGEWDFYPDVGDAPLERVTVRPGRIVVPGAWQTQGFGTPGGTMPASLIGANTSPADHLRHNLTARCLYVRAIEIPSSWQAQRVFLVVRRVYARADVSLNAHRIGEYDGFNSPFEFELTDWVLFGRTNRLVIGVDNRPRAGSETYGTANWFANWGGLGGVVELEARPVFRIDDVFAIPRVAESKVVLRVAIAGQPEKAAAPIKLKAEVIPWGATSPLAEPIAVGEKELTPVPGTFELATAIPHARLWTPDTPFLYVARVQLLQAGKPMDELTVRFGMKEIKAEGSKLLLNGKPLYLSGYGDDATEPLKGMLRADKMIYLERLRLMRSLGFNFVRHHSCVPHDEYLAAADEVGMLVQPEAGMAYTKFWPTAHQLFEREWPQIVGAFRNHPCIWAWCMGNELFLNDLPEADTNDLAVDFSKPMTNGPIESVPGDDNGVFGPPGDFPTHSFKQSNYYRDVAVRVDGQEISLLGQAATRRVFNDGPHELGFKFVSRREGEITRIRYYRVPDEQGSHVGRLWDARGRELARVRFANETASGWQEAILGPAVRINAEEVYVVSVNANTAYGATSAGRSGYTRQDALALVAKAYRQAKELDSTRLVHASDGGQPQAFSDVYSSGGAEKFGPKPFLLHEYGAYTCSLPDFSLIPRLDGVIRPLTYERAAVYVREHRLELVYPRLWRSSLLMRADAQKYYLEAAKARDDNNGFSFWLGIDFPDSPEGCWDEGILNQLWEPKPYLTNGLPDLAGPTVLLCDAGLDARSFYNDETKKVGLQLWHYGSDALKDARVSWQVMEGNNVLQRGERTGVVCGLGERVPLGHITIDRLPGTVPRFIRLEVELSAGPRRVTKNAWEFYAYPRIAPRSVLRGVYTETGDLPGAAFLSTNAPLPRDLRVLITRGFKRPRHEALLQEGKCAVLLLGTGGFKETRAGYFLNQYGSGFGGIIEDHPVFAAIPHQGRLHLGLHQLIAGGGLLDTGSMPQAFRDGAVVWGLKLTGWVSPVKDLSKAVQWSEIVTETQLHLILCDLDLLSEKPESRYVLRRTIEYLLTGQPCSTATRANADELSILLR